MKVLVAALNWGLGHAARSVPVIRELQKQGADVVLASDGAALELLKGEFPELKFYELPSWNIRYPAKGNFMLALLCQLPRIWWSIRREYRRSEKIVRLEQISLVISDNRFGCRSSQVPSFIITHQYFLKSPVLPRIAAGINKRFIRQFSGCLIPDYPEEPTLSGELSHKEAIPFPHYFTGPLVRFPVIAEKNDLDVLVIVSGPEPQRAIFEELVLGQLSSLSLRAVVVLGKPGNREKAVTRGKVTILPHARGEMLSQLINKAGVVISRCGYTTACELALLGKKAVLVPTPGQSEQEYLAEYYAENGWFCIRRQDGLELSSALQEALEMQLPAFDQTVYLPGVFHQLLNSR